MNQATAAALAHPWPMGLQQVTPDRLHIWIDRESCVYKLPRTSPAVGPAAEMAKNSPFVDELMCDQIGGMLLKS